MGKISLPKTFSQMKLIFINLQKFKFRERVSKKKRQNYEIKLNVSTYECRERIEVN